jgi:hypothetical protein
VSGPAPEPQTYQYSVKISQTAKGAATVDVHVYSNNMEAARVQAVQLYDQTLQDLKSKQLSVASEGKV